MLLLSLTDMDSIPGGGGGGGQSVPSPIGMGFIPGSCGGCGKPPLLLLPAPPLLLPLVLAFSHNFCGFTGSCVGTCGCRGSGFIPGWYCSATALATAAAEALGAPYGLY
jgi:hypothetical protein